MKEAHGQMAERLTRVFRVEWDWAKEVAELCSESEAADSRTWPPEQVVDLILKARTRDAEQKRRRALDDANEEADELLAKLQS